MIISVGYEIVHNLAASMNMTAKKYAPKSQWKFILASGESENPPLSSMIFP